MKEVQKAEAARKQVAPRTEIPEPQIAPQIDPEIAQVAKALGDCNFVRVVEVLSNKSKSEQHRVLKKAIGLLNDTEAIQVIREILLLLLMMQAFLPEPE